MNLFPPSIIATIDGGLCSKRATNYIPKMVAVGRRYAAYLIATGR